jgi:hypothetical protein
MMMAGQVRGDDNFFGKVLSRKFSVPFIPEFANTMAAARSRSWASMIGPTMPGSHDPPTSRAVAS